MEQGVSYRAASQPSTNVDIHASEPLIPLRHVKSINQSIVKSSTTKRSIVFLIFGCVVLLIMALVYWQFFSNPFSSEYALLQAKYEQLQARLLRLERLNFQSDQSTNQHSDHASINELELLYPSTLSLHSPGHLQHLSRSTRPRAAVFTLLTLHPTYCRAVWTLYKSLLQTDPEHHFDFVIMYEESTQDKSMLHTDKYCSTLWAFSYNALESPDQRLDDADAQKIADQERKRRDRHVKQAEAKHNHNATVPLASRVGHIRLMPVPTISSPSWHTIPERWQYSMHRLEMFRVLDYEHAIFIDGDTVAFHSIRQYFTLAFDLAAVVDQWDGCARREVMNGGLLSFRPSTYLYEAMKMVFNMQPSCITGTMMFSDQELINCVCGFAEAKKAAIRDLHCGLIPSWAAMYPSDAKCPQFRTEDVAIIHYAFHPKPWDWDNAKCREVAIAEGNPKQRDALVAANQDCHMLDEGQAFYMYWACIDNDGSLIIDSNRDCQLILQNVSS